jgi:cytochrome c
MNKIVAIFALFSIVSCEKKEVIEKESQVMVEEPTNMVMDSATENKHEGLALIEGAACLTCHQKEARAAGPSYQEVANKYTEADIDMLAAKIITGCKGVWGDMPMTAHPEITNDHAKKMVEYILTLKK